MTKTSSNNLQHPYMRGYVHWNANAFWRNNPLYYEKSKRYFESWLSDMRANEKHLTRLEVNSMKGNGVRI